MPPAADVARPKVGVGVFILRRQSASTTDTSTLNSPPPAPTNTQTSSSPPSQSPSKYEFIIGKRKGSHGAGTWALPGGHLEYGESFEDCARREVQEETGLSVTNLKFLTVTNDVMSREGKHYITVFMTCERESTDADKEPVILEPEKCEQWDWMTWDTVVRWALDDGGGMAGVNADGKQDLFLPLISLVQQRPGLVPSL